MSNFIRPDDDALYEAYKQTDNKDTIIDTSYIDPISKHIKPPCSSSPDYCGCIKSHIKASNINITFKCNP